MPKKKDDCIGLIVINNFNQKAKIINISSFDSKNVFFNICFLDENDEETKCFKIASKSNIVAGKFKKTIDYSIFKDEIWTTGYGVEDVYMVSNKGRIKNIKTDVEVCGYINTYGYVQLDIDNIPFNYKHVFIYYSFNKNEDVKQEGYAIDHIDRNKTNNCLLNLRRVTHLENSYNKTDTVIAKIKYLESGEVFTTDRLNEFCRDKNIEISLLYKTYNKERTHTNGYVMIEKELKYVNADGN